MADDFEKILFSEDWIVKMGPFVKNAKKIHLFLRTSLLKFFSEMSNEPIVKKISVDTLSDDLETIEKRSRFSELLLVSPINGFDVICDLLRKPFSSVSKHLSSLRSLSSSRSLEPSCFKDSLLLSNLSPVSRNESSVSDSTLFYFFCCFHIRILLCSPSGVLADLFGIGRSSKNADFSDQKRLFISDLMALPDFVSSALPVEFLSWSRSHLRFFSHSNYFSFINERAVALVVYSSEPVPLWFEFAFKLLSIGKIDFLLKSLLQPAFFPLKKEKIASLIIQILENLSPFGCFLVGQFLDHLFLSVFSPDLDPLDLYHRYQLVSSLLNPFLPSTFCDNNIFVEYLTLSLWNEQKEFDFRCYAVLGAVILDHEDLAITTLKNLLLLWSDHSFHLVSSKQCQLRVTLFVNFFLRELDTKKTEGFPFEGLNVSLMEGVQMRIQSTETSKRQFGMFIAETLSLFLSPSDLLHFEELDSSEIKSLSELISSHFSQAKTPSELESSSSNVSPSPESASEAKEGVERDQKTERGGKKINFDGFEPQSAAEKVPRPNYFREIKGYLCKGDSADHIDAAFESLPKLLSSPLLQLELESDTSLVLGLAKVLVCLNDNFKTPDFVETRLNAICVLTMVSPTVVVPYLTQRVCAENTSFSEKIEILLILTEISKKMSSKPLNNKNLTSFNSSSESVSTNLFVNEFDRFADIFFCPLAEHFPSLFKSKDDFFHNNRLVSVTLKTLCHFFVVIENRAKKTKFAKRLFSLLFLVDFRARVETIDLEVKKALIATICRLLDFPCFAESVSNDDLQLLEQWTDSLLLFEPDRDCQAGAGLLKALVKKACGQKNFLL